MNFAGPTQYKRLRRVLKRQRTVLGILLREVRRKMTALTQEAQDKLAVYRTAVGPDLPSSLIFEFMTMCFM